MNAKKMKYLPVLMLLVLSLVLAACGEDKPPVTDPPTDPTSNVTDPTNLPTDKPTDAPTDGPTDAPTDGPTDAPTDGPTDAPTDGPTDAPTDGPTDAPTDPPTEAPTAPPATEPEHKEMTFTVTVLDGSGNGVNGLIVKCGGKIQVTGKDGTAKFVLNSGTYEFTLNYPDETVPSYDEDAAVLTTENPNVTIVVRSNATETVDLSAPSLANDDYISHKAYVVGEGEFAVEMVKGDMTYVIFIPSRAGVYHVSVSGASVGNYGGPMYVMSTDIANYADDGCIELDIHGYNIGETVESTSKYVLGIQTEDLAGGECVLSIKRVGDVKLTPADAPWNVEEADKKYLVKYEGEADKSLVNIDITSVKLEDLYQDENGYYHYGSADGPLVLVRIDSASEFIASFVTICDTSTFGVYYYDDAGEFTHKVRFNEMIAEYAEICDSKGACPLNDQLIKMVKDFGEFKGWWNKDMPGNYLFTGTPINSDTAWLFACCYYK